MEPGPGLYKWIYDLNLTSLYPSIIMIANIYPETKVAVIKNWNQECLLNKTPQQVEFTNDSYAHDVKHGTCLHKRAVKTCLKRATCQRCYKKVQIMPACNKQKPKLG